MATLPADRSKLALAQSNQVPSAVASSTKNINAITEAYDTLDKLYGYVNQTLQGIYDANKFSRLGIINVMDPPFNAKGDGVTDDSAAINAAATAAGIGGKVFFPKGKYLCKSKLNTLQWQTWEGTSYYLGGSEITQTQIMFSIPNNQGGNCLVMGVNSSINQLYFTGEGASDPQQQICLSASSHIRLNKVQIQGFFQAAKISNSFYSQYYELEISYCSFGIQLIGCFNVNFYGLRSAKIPTAILCSTAIKPLNLFGGSIEGYGGAGGINLIAGGKVNLYGVYFESSDPALTGGVAVSMSNNTSINLSGCYVYLTGTGRFLNASGITNSNIVSHGNKFSCAADSLTNPIAYYLPNVGCVTIAGDDWSEVLLAGAAYVPGGTYGTASFDIKPPAGVGTFANLQVLGRPLYYPVTAAAPATTTKYAVYMADGIIWDPLAKATGKPYMCFYNGTAYAALS